jgi:arylsulfatase A
LKEDNMTRPNIVLILADDMGYGDLGCYGNPDAPTPALDVLAAGGVQLRQHYSASCVCAPARAGLLTGRYPHRTGAIDTLEGRGLDRLALRERTLADRLKAAGYATGLFGKWHLGALDADCGFAYHPNQRGFDEFCGFRGGWQDYFDWRLDRNGSRFSSDGRYLTDVITEEAVGFIERHTSGSSPFFLHVCYNAPHYPLQVPEEDAAPFRAQGRFTEAVCRLYGMIARMDAGIGRLLTTLEERGLTENTLFIFTSDNGPQFSNKEFGPDSLRRFNGNWNGSKGNFYEGGIRVPALARWPGGGITGGRPCDELVHFTDWLPTIAEGTGTSVNDEGLPLDGASVLPILRGETPTTMPARFWQWNRYAPPIAESNAAMRDGLWKLVRPSIEATMRVTPEDLQADEDLKYRPDHVPEISRAPLPPVTLTPETIPAPLLFHLGDDPYEQTDLSQIHPDRVRRMETALYTWFESVEADRQDVWTAEQRA